MGGIRIVGPTVLMTDGVMAGVAVISAKELNMSSLLYGALEAVWTGTPTGTFKVEGSLDNISFFDTGTATTPAAGAAGSQLINFGFPIGFAYMRLTYTNTAGAGLLTVRGIGKGTS